MSREFIDAIASGNNLGAEDEFKSSISSKVGDALEIRRKELSQTFAGNDKVVEEEAKPYVKQKPDGTWCVYDAEGNIVSEHESEDEAKAALSNKKDDEDDEVEEESGQAAYQRSRAARKMGDTEHKVAYASGPRQPKRHQASRQLDQMSKAKIGPTTRTTTMNTGR